MSCGIRREAIPYTHTHTQPAPVGTWSRGDGEGLSLARSLTFGRLGGVKLLGLIEEAQRPLPVAGLQGLAGDLDAFLRLVPVPFHGLVLPPPPPAAAQREGA